MPWSCVCNQSNYSRCEVKCGVCGQKGRRDNLKMKHFQRKHQGIKYVEEGEKQASNLRDFFTNKSKTNEQDSKIQSEDDAMESADDSAHDTEQYEEPTHSEHNTDLHKSIDRIEKKIDNLNINQENELVKDTVFETTTADEKNQYARINTCRTIEDLCIVSGLTLYRNQNKLVCDYTKIN